MKLNFASCFIAFHIISNVINKLKNRANNSLEKNNTVLYKYTFDKPYISNTKITTELKESKQKESHETIEQKESHETIEQKESHETTEQKESHESTEQKESTEDSTETPPITPRSKSKYTDMTVSQLRKLASIYCIKKYTKMSKDELIYEIHLRKNIL